MDVFLVSDLRLLRETLHASLVSSGCYGVVSATSVHGNAWQQMSKSPDVLFVAVEAAEGVDLVGEFRAAHPFTVVGVLALTGRDEEFFTWAGAGISGYVEPDTAVEGIVSTIARLADGETVYPARLSGLLLNQFALRPRPAGPRDGVASLTRRELDVIELLADGQANKQIARRLAITEPTVKNHVHSILDKLNVRNRGQAAAWFRRSDSRRVLDGGGLGLPSMESSRIMVPALRMER